MPTIGTFMQLLPKGFEGATYRSSDATVFSVVEGTGHTMVGDGDTAQRFDWGKRDTFVIPSWRSEEHTSELQSLMRISYAVFCLKKKKQKKTNEVQTQNTVRHYTT